MPVERLSQSEHWITHVFPLRWDPVWRQADESSRTFELSVDVCLFGINLLCRVALLKSVPVTNLDCRKLSGTAPEFLENRYVIILIMNVVSLEH